jgi:hypothetical protein
VNIDTPWHQQNSSRARHTRGLLHEATRTLDQPDPADHPGLLGHIQLLAVLAATAYDQIAETIDEIPVDQRDWDQIAAAMGTTKPQAWHQWRTHRQDPATHII